MKTWKTLLSVTLLVAISILPSPALAKEKISQAELHAFTQAAKQAINEEKSQRKQGIAGQEDQTLYAFSSVGKGYTLNYEQRGNQEPKITVISQEEQPAAANAVRPAVAVNLPDGIGGRVKISKNGSTLTSTVRTATTTQLSGTGTHYIYTGFNSAQGESDIGLQYSPTYSVWKPYFLFQGTGGVHSGQAQYKNGYLPGQDVIFTLYKNYNGKIRFKTQGYANCGDMNCTNTTDTFLVHILESSTTPNVGTINFWKVLATIAGSETGKNYARYGNIQIDGVAAPMGTPETDNASISISTNNAAITVDSALY